MPNRETYHSLQVDQLVDPATVTSDTNSSAVDMQGYDSLTLLANVGESGDTLSSSVKIEFEVEHADDDGAGSPDTWSDVSDGDLLNFVSGTNDGTFALVDDPAEDDAAYLTGYVGGKRHVRVVINVTGTHSSGTPISVSAIRSHAGQQPVN